MNVDRKYLVVKKNDNECDKLKKWLEEAQLEFDEIDSETDTEFCRTYQISTVPSLVVIEDAKPGISTYDAYLVYIGYEDIIEAIEYWGF